VPVPRWICPTATWLGNHGVGPGRHPVGGRAARRHLAELGARVAGVRRGDPVLGIPEAHRPVRRIREEVGVVEPARPPELRRGDRGGRPGRADRLLQLPQGEIEVAPGRDARIEVAALRDRGVFVPAVDRSGVDSSTARGAPTRRAPRRAATAVRGRDDVGAPTAGDVQAERDRGGVEQSLRHDLEVSTCRATRPRRCRTPKHTTMHDRALAIETPPRSTSRSIVTPTLAPRLSRDSL
jgi:hypothetical protein